MKVYALIKTIPYEFSEIVAIFASENIAEDYKKDNKLNDIDGIEYYYIEEHKIIRTLNSHT